MDGFWKKNSCHTRVSSLRCANASNAVETLCNRLELHETVFILSVLKTNTAAWRFQNVLDSTLWQERCLGVVGMPRAHCKDAM